MRLGVWFVSARKYQKSGLRSRYYTLERLAALERLGIIWDKTDTIRERNYDAARKWYEEHGNLDVPRNTILNGVKLGSWIQELKLIYRGKRGGRSLTEEQIHRLSAIGMQWKSIQESAWERGLAEARAYAQEHGSLDAPYSYVSPSGFKLGVWHTKCREKYAADKLTPEQIAILESLGIVWNRARKNDWDHCYALVSAYYDEHGDILLPPDYKADGIWLNKWLNEQKQILLGKRKGKSLTEEQKQKLDDVGFDAIMQRSRRVEG